MEVFDFNHLPPEIVWQGALDFDVREKGISPRRLPKWSRAQVPALMEWVVRTPSGVRLLIDTDATQIDITALATNTVTPPEKKRPVVFDLQCNGQTFSQSSLRGNTITLNRQNPEDIKIQRSDADVWSFKNLPATRKVCELWLPHNAVVELRQLSLSAGATLFAHQEDDRKRWIHYGSSISHCAEALQPTETWPAIAASQLGWNLQSLGLGGQCHLDPFIARTIAQSNADVISIKVGINVINMDSMRERVFTPLLHGFIDTIRELKPDTPIVLISPIFCPSAEAHPGPTIPDNNGIFQVVKRSKALANGSLTLSRVREILEEFVTQRNDQHLSYLDGLKLFNAQDESDLPDALHPNPEGYKRLAKRFVNIIEERQEQVR